MDPSEYELIKTSDAFANEYAELLAQVQRKNNFISPDLTLASLNETLRFREFKQAGASGIQACEIESVILPLLADHVLREANHYIRFHCQLGNICCMDTLSVCWAIRRYSPVHRIQYNFLYCFVIVGRVFFMTGLEIKYFTAASCKGTAASEYLSAGKPAHEYKLIGIGNCIRHRIFLKQLFYKSI